MTTTQARCDHYHTTIDSCECLSRFYHPEVNCCHMIHMQLLDFTAPMAPPSPITPIDIDLIQPNQLANPNLAAIFGEEDEFPDHLFWECDGCARPVINCECPPTTRKRKFKELSEEKKTQDCAICMESLESDHIIETECDHHFHLKCLTKWYKRVQNCPMCRKKVKN